MSKISHEKVHDNEVMVSFDVESLFTTPTQIADLLNFVLRSTYFQYNGSIYEQQDGAAMGGSLSAVIAAIHME